MSGDRSFEILDDEVSRDKVRGLSSLYERKNGEMCLPTCFDD